MLGCWEPIRCYVFQQCASQRDKNRTYEGILCTTRTQEFYNNTRISSCIIAWRLNYVGGASRRSFDLAPFQSLKNDSRPVFCSRFLLFPRGLFLNLSPLHLLHFMCKTVMYNENMIRTKVPMHFKQAYLSGLRCSTDPPSAYLDFKVTTLTSNLSDQK